MIQVDLKNSVANYLVANKSERKNTLNYLKTNYPPNSVIGITKDDGTTLELWILEWGYIKDISGKGYIIGGRAAGVADSECYVIKPILERENLNGKV